MRCVWVGVVVAALVTGCDRRAAVGQDGAVQDVRGLRDMPWWWLDSAPADVRRWADSRDLPTRARDLVCRRLVLPDTTTASKIGHDYDNDGTIDNALGAILGGLSQIAGGTISLQQAMDTAVNRGWALLLLRLQASSLANDPAASARTWLAAPQTCCTSPQSPAQCAAQANASCFSGANTFQPDPADPQGSLMSGSIVSGAFSFGPGPMKLPLTLGSSVITLDLEAAYLTGTITGGMISNGVLAGAVPQSQLQTTLVPTVAKTLDSLLKDPSTAPQVKGIIESLFDADHNGSITVAEVKSSTVVKTFLGGDTDVDGDGVKELTLGLGFEVVTAVIVP